MRRLAILTLAFLGCHWSFAQFRSAQLQATGLTCALCSNAINKSLQKLPFTGSVKADVEHSSFLIRFKEGVRPDPDAIRKAVEDAGFNIGELKMNAVFSHVKVVPGALLEYEGLRMHIFNKEEVSLDGERTLTFMDKGFVTQKVLKRTATGERSACLQSGRASQCPEGKGLDPNTRIFHVSL